MKLSILENSPMSDAQEQDVLDETAMSIGTDLDMQKMLNTFLSVITQQLSCTVCSVLLRDSHTTPFHIEIVLPSDYGVNKQFEMAMEVAMAAIEQNQALPCPLNENITDTNYYGWHIDDMALVIIGRSEPLTIPIYRELGGLLGKLSHAIAACRQYRYLSIAQAELKDERILLQSLIDNLGYGVLVEDSQGETLHINEQFVRMFDTTRIIPEIMSGNAIHSSYMNQLFVEPDFFLASTIHEMEHGKPSYNTELLCKDGRVFERDYLPFEISNGGICHLWQYKDVTDRKETERQLQESQVKMEYLAHHDVLTSLPNRLQLEPLIRKGIKQVNRSNKILAICFIDLDNFKVVNDTYGHELGDHVLIETGQRLSGAIRSTDSVARLGGDEFVVLLNDIADMEELTSALDRILGVVSMPLDLNGVSLNLTASIGATIFPFDDSDTDTLLRHADQAMYRAKQSGRNCYKLFDIELEHETGKYQQKIDRLWQALNNDEFVLYYQPKVNLRTGDVYGVEALLRWQHPELGNVLPHEFLPIVDANHDLTVAVGEWVISSAMKQLNDWSAEGLPLNVSVNVSAVHLQKEEFIEQISVIVGKFHPDLASNLELEILETAAIESPSSMRKVLEKCSRLGIQSSIDDFGTGYSSLSYLKHLPVDNVKIDQTFVRDMQNDMDDFAIIDGVIRLASAFKNKVIAEGIEHEEQGIMLIQLGCDHGQGYFIAKPMLASQIPEWMNSYQIPSSWQDMNHSLALAKAAEEEREQLRQKLHQANIIIESSPAVLFEWRPTEGWPIDYVSNNVAQFGYSASELLDVGMHYSTIVHPDDLERLAGEVEVYSDAGIEQFNQEYRIVSPAGVVFWVDDRTTIERDSSGNVARYRGVILDITQRKQMEQELVTNKNKSHLISLRLAEAQRLSHIGSWNLDMATNQIFRTDEMFRIFGLDPDNMSNSAFLEAIHPDDRKYVNEQYNRALEGEVTYDIEYRIIRKDNGEERWVHSTCEHLRDHLGKVIACNGTVQDITERKLSDYNK